MSSHLTDHGANLINLSCWHDIVELLLVSTFTALGDQDQSKSPSTEIFETLRNLWSTFNLQGYAAGVADPEKAALLQTWADESMQKAQQLLQEKHSRDDYKGVLELVVIFLGGMPYGSKDVRLMAPSALPRARWMARALYALKIWMFRMQFARAFFPVIIHICTLITK